jgi:hypothetical protein
MNEQQANTIITLLEDIKSNTSGPSFGDRETGYLIKIVDDVRTITQIIKNFVFLIIFILGIGVLILLMPILKEIRLLLF